MIFVWLNGLGRQLARAYGIPYPILNIPATLSPTSVGDAHNWRVFIA